MGCGNSQQSVVSFEPLPAVTQSSNVTNDLVHEDGENSSDFYIPLEDASDEVLTLLFSVVAIILNSSDISLYKEKLPCKLLFEKIVENRPLCSNIIGLNKQIQFPLF